MVNYPFHSYMCTMRQQWSIFTNNLLLQMKRYLNFPNDLRLNSLVKTQRIMYVMKLPRQISTPLWTSHRFAGTPSKVNEAQEEKKGFSRCKGVRSMHATRDDT